MPYSPSLRYINQLRAILTLGRSVLGRIFRQEVVPLGWPVGTHGLSSWPRTPCVERASGRGTRQRRHQEGPLCTTPGLAGPLMWGMGLMTASCT